MPEAEQATASCTSRIVLELAPLYPRAVREPLGRRVVPPPHAQERRIARRQLGRPPVHVPHGDALEGRVPLRHDVVVPQQHPVERPRGGDQVVAVLGQDDLVDQLVDRGVLDADDVAAAVLAGGIRAPDSRAARCRATATGGRLRR